MSTPITFSKSVWLSLALCLFCGVFSGSATAQQIQWRQDLELAKAEALKTNRLVWLHFTADWCLPCKRLETFVFNDTSLIRVVDQNTVAVKVDADKNDSLVKAFDVPRIPFDIVMTPGGEVIINRRSPSRVTDYLKMFNGLDVPLQALNSGERELINARIGKIQKLVQKSGGNDKKTSALGLDGPSHQMASTTVEGQRLERGFESANRAAETRAAAARLLKLKAEKVLAEEIQKQTVGSGPKISINPFFKPDGSEPKLPQFSTPSQHELIVKNEGTSSASQQINSLRVNNQQELKNAPGTINNHFVVKPSKAVPRNHAEIDPEFLPPLPPSFEQEVTNRDAGKITEQPTTHSDPQEFNFAEIKSALKQTDVVAAAENEQTQNNIAENQFLPQQPPAQSLALPKFSEFSDHLNEKSTNNDFVGVPVRDLSETLKITPKPNVNMVPQKETAVDIVNSQRLANIGESTGWKQQPTAKKRTIPFPPSKPVMKTTVSVPQPPVMVEGTVKVAEMRIPTIEGRLVAGEQNRNEKANGNQHAQQGEPKNTSQAEQLLQHVNFFGTKKHAESMPGKTAAQSQVVINVNTGSSTSSQTVQEGARVFIVPPAVEDTLQKSTASIVKDRHAKVVSANTIATSKINYALQGKCPVTLLTEGRWVDGQQQFGCVHRDRVYLFATAANRDIFLANPDQMSPLLAGFDPVIFEETGKLVAGEEKFGTFMGEQANRRIVLFKTADTRARFQNEPVKYLNVVRNAMTKSAPKDTKLR